MFRLQSHRQTKLRTMKFFTVWLGAFGIYIDKVNIVVPREKMKSFLCVETRKGPAHIHIVRFLNAPR